MFLQLLVLLPFSLVLSLPLAALHLLQRLLRQEAWQHACSQLLQLRPALMQTVLLLLLPLQPQTESRTLQHAAAALAAAGQPAPAVCAE